VEAMFSQATIIETTDAVKLRAAQRAIDKRVPFHHEGKNSINDAILIEVYAQFVAANKKVTLCLVTDVETPYFWAR
jgi:hypothetical protein